MDTKEKEVKKLVENFVKDLLALFEKIDKEFENEAIPVDNNREIKEAIMENWNTMIADRFKLSRISEVNDTRLSNYKARLKECGGDKSLFWNTVYHKLSTNNFYTGNNNRGWKAGIDFFLTRSKFLPMLEDRKSVV